MINLNKIWEDFKSPTSPLFRKIGDICMIVGILGSITLSHFKIVDSQITEAIAFAALLGKLLTDTNNGSSTN